MPQVKLRRDSGLLEQRIARRYGDVWTRNLMPLRIQLLILRHPPTTNFCQQQPCVQRTDLICCELHGIRAIDFQKQQLQLSEADV